MRTLGLSLGLLLLSSHNQDLLFVFLHLFECPNIVLYRYLITLAALLVLTLLDEFEDQVVLLLRLHGDEVHTVLAAQVTAVQPVEFLVTEGGHVAAEEVMATFVEEFLWPWNK